LNHILIGLALCAGVLLYPGGLTLLGASCLLAVGATLGRPPVSRWRVPGGSRWVPLGLASLAVIPLPWPGSPLLELSVGGLSQAGVGGLALSVLGLFGLEMLIAADQPDRPLRVLASAASLLAILILAEALGAADWGSLLAAPGPGAEAGRLGIAAICLLVGPWAAGRELGVEAKVTCAWAVRASIFGFLALPQVAGLPVWPVLGGWLGACLMLGGLVGLVRRLTSGRPPKSGAAQPGW
jgi:hypothetical protein